MTPTIPSTWIPSPKWQKILLYKVKVLRLIVPA